MRKPVQIAISDDMNFEAITDCVVLCDDGSMWITNYSHIKNKSAEWTRLPDIPQDNPERDLQSNAPHSLRFLRTEYRWGLEGHQSGWHLSVGDVGALLDVVTAAQRVVVRHDAGERPINVEELRLKLSVLEQ